MMGVMAMTKNKDVKTDAASMARLMFNWDSTLDTFPSTRFALFLSTIAHLNLVVSVLELPECLSYRL